jgi:hypothetical protein
MAKKTRARTQRREAERALSKLQAAREQLFRVEPGGSPQQPLEVPSPALVEAHARSVSCPRCDGTHELLEHAAITRGGARLREARLRCRQCGSLRSVWFRIRPETPSAALN